MANVNDICEHVLKMMDEGLSSETIKNTVRKKYDYNVDVDVDSGEFFVYPDDWEDEFIEEDASDYLTEKELNEMLGINNNEV